MREWIIENNFASNSEIDIIEKNAEDIAKKSRDRSVSYTHLRAHETV